MREEGRPPTEQVYVERAGVFQVPVQVQVIGAYGLARADIGLVTKGKSDPFCEFIWNDDMIHKTKVPNFT